MTRIERLPIDPYLEEAVSSLKECRRLVLTAPPGTGKTTRVPPALLDSGLAGEGKILMLEPRRIAARSAAARMARERGVPLGGEVGYQVRFDSREGPDTRILVVTEGILMRRMQSDPFLKGITAVILDEFHERSLYTDQAIAFLKDLTKSAREDLKVVVMSATLDTEPVASFLGECPVLEIAVDHHPVHLSYLDRRSEQPLHIKAARGIAGALEEGGQGGDILVFLPGMAEIRATEEAIRVLADDRGLEVLPLHGDLPLKEQERALRPQKRRKVILSTNVAETSLTIEGVDAVVDTGYARVLRHDPRYGMDRLELKRISKASADQRAGRAGRIGPGRAFRLWTLGEHASLAREEIPEIMRADLASPVLEVLAWGSDPLEFLWYEMPPLESIKRSIFLLQRLGAVEPGGRRITSLGRDLLELPVHPRLGKMLLSANRKGFSREGAVMAALLSEKDILSRSSGKEGRMTSSSSDLLFRMERLKEAEQAGFQEDILHGRGVLAGPAKAVQRAAKQYESMGKRLKGRARKVKKPGEEDLLRLLLAGFPDRVGRRREKGGDDVLMVGGRGARLARDSVVREGTCLLGLNVEGGRKGIHAKSLIRIASRVEPDWLKEDFPDLLRSEETLSFDDEREKVRGVRRLFYEDLPLEESELTHFDRQEASKLLEAAAAEGMERALAVDEPAAAFLARVRSLRAWMPELDLPAFDSKEMKTLLPAICCGRTSFAELRRIPLLPLLKERLGYDLLEALESHAPERIEAPSGRMVGLIYEPGRPPRLAIRLQEMFGLKKTPSVAGGRIKILLDLLGPNMRTVQLTEDLENFWKNTYARVRKDLKGRYPKHYWPEDPMTANPTAGSRRRRS